MNIEAKGINKEIENECRKKWDSIAHPLHSLGKLEDVKFIEAKGESCLFEVTCDPAKDVREEVSFALSDARLLILEMSEETSTLEDIYLTLVKEADEAYEAELKAIREGADLDEVFADKEETEEVPDTEEVSGSDEDTAEESDSDSKEE